MIDCDYTPIGGVSFAEGHYIQAMVKTAPDATVNAINKLTETVKVQNGIPTDAVLARARQSFNGF